MRGWIKAGLGAVALATSAGAQAADWWWVAGDSRDSAAVFVDGETAIRTGDTASVRAVWVDRQGATKEMVWRGRCSDRHADEQFSAVARFACGTEEEHMQDAALLGGLTPGEAARAIFQVHGAAPARQQPVWS